MQTKKRISAVVLGVAAMGAVLEGCSKTETTVNTVAAQPVNARTPTVEEIIDAKRREREAAANKAAANGVLTSADVQKMLPKTTPFPTMPKMNDIDWKKISDKAAQDALKNMKR